jgi:N-acetylmuramoyl-L-alanine amidase
MATATINPSLEETTSSAGVVEPLCPPGQIVSNSSTDPADSTQQPSRPNTLQALLAFSALREQVRRRKETRPIEDDAAVPAAELEEREQFTLEEVLQLVSDMAVAITGADGLAIAMAENDEIVLRAAAGTLRPNLGARIDRDSYFSGACFRKSQILSCGDTETDTRVNLQACRSLGVRSMVAVPLCGRRCAIGLLQAFSAQPFGFNDRDVRNLGLLAELVRGALTPEDEDRFAESAQIAATKLEAAPSEPEAVAVAEPEMPAEVRDRVTRRPGTPVLLVSIVIVSALVGGAWWKLKPSQSVNKMVRTETMVPSRMVSKAKDTSVAPFAGTAASQANLNPGASSGESRATNSPAKLPMVTGIEHRSSADSSTVVLNLEDQVQYEAHRLANPDRIYFDLHDTEPASELAWKTIEVGDRLLERIRVAQPATGMTRIVLETKAKTDFSVSLQPNPYRLVVELGKVGPSPKGALNQSTNATEAEKNTQPILVPLQVPPPTEEDLQLRRRVAKMRIVIDAGHGGRDRGTVGRDGLLEKDLVLEIGRRLGKLLETRLGMEVIYTRQNDSYIPLAERASIANQAQADLFVSVHANYSDLPSARGVETYFTSLFTVPASKDVEMRPGEGGAGNAAASVSPADLQGRVEQSRRLAESVQRSLYRTLSAQTPGLRDRGIREAPFVVLTESAMPGILAEVSFVSSPTDEQKLRSVGYREQVAEALYKGIARYAASSHAVKVASAQRRPESATAKQ